MTSDRPLSGIALTQSSLTQSSLTKGDVPTDLPWTDLPHRDLFPAKLLEILPGGSQAKGLAAGGFLFREGDRQTSLFILAGGLVQLSILVPGRGDVPILTVGPGELIAWSAVLSKQPMTCTAMALEDSKLLEFPSQSIEDLVDRDPQFAMEFYRWIAFGLSERLTATRLQLLDLFQHPNA